MNYTTLSRAELIGLAIKEKTRADEAEKILQLVLDAMAKVCLENTKTLEEQRAIIKSYQSKVHNQYCAR